MPSVSQPVVCLGLAPTATACALHCLLALLVVTQGHPCGVAHLMELGAGMAGIPAALSSSRRLHSATKYSSVGPRPCTVTDSSDYRDGAAATQSVHWQCMPAYSARHCVSGIRLVCCAVWSIRLRQANWHSLRSLNASGCCQAWSQSDIKGAEKAPAGGFLPSRASYLSLNLPSSNSTTHLGSAP